MKKILTFTSFILIILVAILTRFYKLGEAPTGLYLDEAAQGYNAYSILKTGKDEFGKTLPIVFRSFTDFKTPVYIYLIVPLIQIFDLTKFTVRLPSAVFSILTFPFVYLLLKKLIPDKSPTLPLLVCLFLAISPWHVLFGRTNFETNVAIFFFVAGTYFFYKGLEKPLFLIISGILFAIAIPSYHSQRIITPLILAVLFIKYKNILFSKPHIKPLITSIVLGLLISLPTLSVATTPGFLMRASGLNIFSHLRQKPAGYKENCKSIFCPIINNSIYLSTKEFAGLYISYFSPRSMFILGDSGPRSSYPSLSTFYIWQFPFYIYGIYTLLKSGKTPKDLKFFVLSMLLVSPVPAALTRDPYSTIRSEPLVIPQIIIFALGFYELINKFKSKIVITSIWATLLVVVMYSLTKLYSSVIILNEHYRATEWNYGWEEVSKTIQLQDRNLPTIVDNSRSEPYSQLLFFLKFDPETYQKENFEVPIKEYYTNMDRNKNKKIGNITTRPIIWNKDIYEKQYLIGDGLSISQNQINEHQLELVRLITYPDWSIAFKIVKTNPEAKCIWENYQNPLCKPN